MAEKNEMDSVLDDLFAQARVDDLAKPSEDLMARVLSDAEALQAPMETEQTQRTQRGFWASLLETLGGWQGASGLAAATMASLMVGFSSAEALTIEGLQTVFSGDADYYISDLGTAFNFEEDG